MLLDHVDTIWVSYILKIDQNIINNCRHPRILFLLTVAMETVNYHVIPSSLFMWTFFLYKAAYPSEQFDICEQRSGGGYTVDPTVTLPNTLKHTLKQLYKKIKFIYFGEKYRNRFIYLYFNHQIVHFK